MAFADPPTTSDSWTFDLDPGGVDPVLKIPRLQDAYLKRFPDYAEGHHGARDRRRADGRRSSPTTSPRSRWTSPPSGRSSTATGAPQLYPEELRDEIDEVAQRVYTEVNNGVYRCGFAGSQECLRQGATTGCSPRWTGCPNGSTNQRYLVGDTITEADVRLFTTLARFDPVYHGHFKCNRHKLAEMPVLWAYARDLFQTPGFGDTTDFVQIKQHYYIVHKDINPTQIVPKGPDLSNWLTPHGREALGGRPFGDGTPPGPTREGERVPAGHGAG